MTEVPLSAAECAQADGNSNEQTQLDASSPGMGGRTRGGVGRVCRPEKTQPRYQGFLLAVVPVGEEGGNLSDAP